MCEKDILVPPPTVKENSVVNYLSLASFTDNFEQLPQGIMKLLKSQLLTWLSPVSVLGL